MASTAATDVEDDFVVDITHEDDIVDTFFSVTPEDLRCFNPGASSPPALVQAPINSPSKHGYLDNRTFEKVVRVTICTETLDLDPGLVGDANGVRGIVVSRYYHHVTGTPMFQVDFGDAIGARAVRVSDSAVAAAESNSDSAALDCSEDPMKELGLYSYDKDVSRWPFDRVFADDQWQDQSITLVNNTTNFIGPQPGPTSAMASRPTEYFMLYWPPHILQRVVDETNRYAAQPSQLNNGVTNGRAEWTPLDSEELLAWFGILMLMGLKEFPHIRCYWDRTPFYNCPLISKAMPLKRFEAII